MRLLNKLFTGVILVVLVLSTAPELYAVTPTYPALINIDNGRADWDSFPMNEQAPYIAMLDSAAEFREEPSGHPATFRLGQNYPNPFNPSTVIRFEIIRPVEVQLSVFDMLGRKVATLVNEYKSAGQYEVRWVAEGVPAGVYFYHLRAGGFSETRSLTVLK